MEGYLCFYFGSWTPLRICAVIIISDMGFMAVSVSFIFSLYGAVVVLQKLISFLLKASPFKKNCHLEIPD